MSTGLRKHDVENTTIDNRRLIAGLRQALDIAYTRLLETTRREWERNFAGKDPSDACVSVRVTGASRRQLPLPCAGVLRKPGRSLLIGSRHALLQ